MPTGDLNPRSLPVASGRFPAPRRAAPNWPRPSRTRLTPAEERALTERIARGGAGALSARHELTERMQGLVRAVAVRYVRPDVDMDELLQEGTIGLLQAIDRFDPARGTRLSTYATPCIQQAIERRGGDVGRSVRLPAYLVEGLRKVRKLASTLAQQLGREPLDAELAAAAGRPASEVRELLSLARRPLSLDAPMTEDGGPLGDLIGDGRGPAFVEVVGRQELAAQIQELLRGLPARDRLVLERRFGFDGGDPPTHLELSLALGVSRERVRQIEAAAIARLRGEASRRALHDLL